MSRLEEATMGWDRRHRRGEVLRSVSDQLDRHDLLAASAGRAVPALEVALDCPGVVDTFADDVDLVAALLLRWHARLSAQLERALAREPRDLPAAVARAWTETARDLPGVRRLLDEQLDTPVTDAMSGLVRRARDKERARLAWAAGQAAGEGRAAVAAGARLEQAARDRLALRDAGAGEHRGPVATASPVAGSSAASSATATSASFVQRLRALIPA